MKDNNRDRLPILIADVLVDDILESSDEDILNDAREEYEDLDSEINKTRSLIFSAAMKSKKLKLTILKKEINQNKTSANNVLSLPVDAKRKLIEDAKKSVGSLTLAARNEDEISEIDTDSVIQDLIDLGVIDENGNLR